ncbi:hypothetical protein ACFZCP_18960 [Streptomyces sp. NPDC007971]|uniref:hypothetical protein n=1 Tax=Streptomyces sp. NPDC007971 TaxID=3364799 RepID=UPI0036E93AD0
MGKLNTLTTATALAALAALAVGCNSTSGDTSKALHTSSPASPSKASASDRPEHVPGESVTKAPTLPDGEVVAQAANASGNREMDIRGGLKSGALSVLVNCQGKGKLTVLVQPVGLSFPLECVDGEVSSTYNQLNLKHTRTYGPVSVTAPSNVRWALTAGQ